MHLSAIDREILNCLQEDLPIDPKPFAILSKQLGITEDELLQRITKLKNNKIIRCFGARVNHKSLGFKSNLIAFRVSPEKIDYLAEKIIAYPEATHCFQRKGEYNLWVAFIYKNDRMNAFIKAMEKEIGENNILLLPTIKQFKLKTRLNIE